MHMRIPPAALTLAYGGFVWIGDEKEEVLRKIDAKPGQVVGEPIALGAFPSVVAAGPPGGSRRALRD